MPWQGHNKRYDTLEWQRARKAALDRAGNRCEVMLDGCQVRATEVDHVLGFDADPTHSTLRAVCSRCHRKITARQGNDARRGRSSSADPEPRPRTAW